jgi:hypothetical protein
MGNFDFGDNIVLRHFGKKLGLPFYFLKDYQKKLRGNMRHFSKIWWKTWPSLVKKTA